VALPNQSDRKRSARHGIERDFALYARKHAVDVADPRVRAAEDDRLMETVDERVP
jgi:hypothetical protein